MLAIMAGIVFIILAIVLFTGAITLGHAFALFLLILGIALVAGYAVPGAYVRRVR